MGAPSLDRALWAERLSRRNLARLALGLAVGLAGGALAAWAGAPLAWMLGSLFACMAASLVGAPVMVPVWFRTLFLGIIGLFLGESFSNVHADDLARWPATMLAAALYVPVAASACYLLFRGAAKMPKGTALLSALPGGLTAVSLFAGEVGGDEGRVALAQSLRVAMVVLAAPVIAFGWLGLEPPADVHAAAPDVMGAGEALLLVAVAVAATWLAGRGRIPLPYLVGPLIASAALRPTGLVEGALPVWLVEAGLLVCGASIGTRFAGFGPAVFVSVAFWTVAGTVVLMAVSLLFAAVATSALGVDFFAALLAYAPGGVAEMSLIALAIDADPAFVATHHMVRIFAILLALPALAEPLRRLMREEGRDARGSPPA